MVNISYIGGSLIEWGGYNLLELVVFLVGVLVGFYIYNFDYIYFELISV